MDMIGGIASLIGTIVDVAAGGPQKRERQARYAAQAAASEYQTAQLQAQTAQLEAQRAAILGQQSGATFSAQSLLLPAGIIAAAWLLLRK